MLTLHIRLLILTSFSSNQNLAKDHLISSFLSFSDKFQFLKRPKTQSSVARNNRKDPQKIH